MEVVSMSCAILDIIKNQDLILTVNQRLSRYLTRLSDQQNSFSSNCWPTARILPLSSWIQEIWQHNAPDMQLLTPWQELNVWRKIIANDDKAMNINPMLTAHHCQQAWAMINNWDIDPLILNQSDNSDIQTFASWLSEFIHYLKSFNFISANMLLSNIGVLLKNNKHLLPKKIALIGFDEITPSQQELIDTLSDLTDIKCVSSHLKASSISQSSFHDAKLELHSVLNWANEKIGQGARSIGIVVPDLANQRHLIEHHVKSFPSHHFNIAGGKKLTDHLLIQTALHVLSLNQQQININTAYQWLQSPYVNLSTNDQQVGAWLDSQLRQAQVQQLPLIQLLQIIPKSERALNSSWLNRWRQLLKTIEQQPKQAKPSAWSTYWLSCLKALGWPGGHTLSSHDFQLLEKFKTTLKEFSELDKIEDSMPCSQALGLLTRLCQNTLFQSEGSSAPIQILGLLECAGLEFDALWVVGLDALTWPPSAKPHPFIPINLQRQLNIPHCSAQRELEYSEKIMLRLQKSAPEIHFSWHQTEGDQPLNPSPLLHSIPLLSIPISTLTKTEQNTPIALEYIEDTHALTLSQNTTTRGGSSILKTQAACPFKAFSTIRLRASALPEPYLGLTPQKRGTIMHHVLENIWNILKDSTALKQLDDNELELMVSTEIEKVLHHDKQSNPSTFSHWTIDIETKRLNQMIKKWLEIEKERPDFKVIATEKSVQTQLGGLHLNLTIDRIDRLEDNTILLIDYKTSAPPLQKWFNDNLTEPQLPLYSIIDSEQPADGISYAEIKAHNLQFKGINNASGSCFPTGTQSLSKIKKAPSDDWEALKLRWKHQLMTLSDNFCQGDASVTPAHPSVCQYCDLHSFCRINTL
jgi:ATP-dependent helicase/nuclease subunit B